jgi:hypothetical protein
LIFFDNGDNRGIVLFFHQVKFTGVLRIYGRVEVGIAEMQGDPLILFVQSFSVG